jgi:hypothetical protein
MVAVFGVGSLLLIGAVIGSAWGVTHALSRSNRSWAVVFASCFALLVLTGLGVALIHAPYLLRSLDELGFLAMTLFALGCIAWYLLGERIRAAHQ